MLIRRTISLADGTADFDNAIVTRKHDSSGNLLWEQKYSDSRGPDVWNSVIDQDDNLYQLIELNGAAWHPGEEVLYRDTLKILMYDRSGNSTLMIHDPMGEDGAQSLSFASEFGVDSNGCVYVSVRRSNAAGNYDELVLRKYDPEGNLLWIKLISELKSWYPSEFHISSTGEIVLSYFLDQYNDDRHVSKYDSNGNLVWQNHLSSSCPNTINLTVSDSGQVFLLSSQCLESFSAERRTFVACCI